MFLRTKTRKKNGKVHRYFSVVENQRVGGPGRGGQRVVQRELLHLGELNDAQHAGWLRAIEAICVDGPCGVGQKSGGENCPDSAASPMGERAVAQQMMLFPDDRRVPQAAVSDSGCEAVSIRISGIELQRPRAWGGCFLALWLWDLLALDGFWAPRLGESRKGTRWLSVLKLLVTYRLLSPGSELRLYQEWAANSAMGDLLGEDASLWAKNTLYRALDTLQPHRDDLFAFLRTRWQDLFNVGFDVLLYDLTSTTFEVDAHATAPDSRSAMATAVTAVQTASRWSLPWCSRPKDFPWATRFTRATPPTQPPCASSSKRLSAFMEARCGAPGSWIGASPPRKLWSTCATQAPVTW
jgi:hypothetical protein